LISAIGEAGGEGEHPLQGLEEASRTTADWADALARYYGAAPSASGAAPAWDGDLRAFLADNPESEHSLAACCDRQS
jgi:hypothetical protein